MVAIADGLNDILVEVVMRVVELVYTNIIVDVLDIASTAPDGTALVALTAYIFIRHGIPRIDNALTAAVNSLRVSIHTYRQQFQSSSAQRQPTPNEDADDVYEITIDE